MGKNRVPFRSRSKHMLGAIWSAIGNAMFHDAHLATIPFSAPGSAVGVECWTSVASIGKTTQVERAEG